MSAPHHVRRVKVLKAVSSSLRLQILNLLFDKGPLSYTELMSSLKMNPTRDAGRFAYHLKFLLKADLIEADVEMKKYCLTELGKMIIDVADRVDKKVSRQKGMLVRTSRLELEEFDANKIANSLIKEAKIPAELAQKVAKEAEKRLISSKAKYLTAPLVREIANAILVEKGLEEYRHKLTRLGVPVYDVAALLDAKGKYPRGSASIQKTAGEMVFREYALLTMFPRDIADAHISGSLHINDLGSWILKPSEIMHDLRFFLRNGLNLEKIDAFQPLYSPPKTLDSALSMIFSVLLHSAKETVETQTIDYFNVFLAPFAKNLDPTEVKEALRSFIFNVAQHVDAALSLELAVPDFIADKSAFGQLGKVVGNHKDFTEESQLLASLILDIFAEESVQKPLFNPKIIVKIRSETLTDPRAKALLLKAHNLASEKGVPYFANLLEKNLEHSVFSASGSRFDADLSGDWEVDTLRTGCLGYVTVNLPRIVYDCEKDKAKFLELLKDRLEMASRALDIKHNTLKQHGEASLPFLMQTVDGDQYFRLSNCSRLISFAGIGEAAEAFCGKTIHEDDAAMKFADEMAQNIWDFIRKIGRKHGKRLLPAVLPSHEASVRLARLDMERCGIGRIRFSGTRERPYYSTICTLTIQGGKVPQQFMMAEQTLHGLHVGGNLAVLELGEVEMKPDDLMALTRQFVEEYGMKFFAYNRRLTYCTRCKRSWFGLLHKCPSCGAIGTLTVFDRFASV